MTTNSFADIGSYNWQPVSAYQTVQSLIQQEVDQGLWANQAHVDGWCSTSVAPVQGADNSWVIYTYQLISDSTQTTTVVWPAGWPAPAENINGQLPNHFFSGGTTSSSTTTDSVSRVPTRQALYETYASPTGQPTYKAAGACI